MLCALLQGPDSRTQGRYLTALQSRQHNTSTDFLKHYGRTQVDSDYRTVYTQRYRGSSSPCEQPVSHRRFAKTFPQANSGLAKLSTTAVTSPYSKPDVPYKTPTRVLAVSQQPFLGPNKWKYSYHGLPKCYPPYDRLDQGGLKRTSLIGWTKTCTSMAPTQSGKCISVPRI